MSGLEIELIPAMSDNYIYVVREPQSGQVGVVDPGVAAPVIACIDQREKKLDWILLTHHHADHIGGMAELKRRYGSKVAGPKADTARISDMDVNLSEGDRFTFGDEEARIFETPGHTSGHISIWFPASHALFCGDTLFALGCGRLFEGTPEMMWRSLSKFADLPGDTRIFCGHEYTQSNARFAVTVDPDNEVLKQRAERIDSLRARNEPTIPSTLAEERATNPFLRPDDPMIREALRMRNNSDAEVFGEIRRRKDSA